MSQKPDISSKIKSVKKRDGQIVPFNQEKITNAVFKATVAVGQPDREQAQQISTQVTDLLNQRYPGDYVPNIEEIQDIVEEVLKNYPTLANVYKLHRTKRAETREFRRLIGVEDELKLDPNALTVLKKRYLLKDTDGNIIETPAQLFRRVARAVAGIEVKFDPEINVKKIEEDFYSMLVRREFMPNTPTLMNAGTELGQLSACFILPVGDSLPEIFDAIKYTALIQQSGGGTGYNFSHLRPRGDIVKSTQGVASGPVSFMSLFDRATEVIKQGGKRRGANMGILNADHPDIIEFITAKTKEGFLTNFNISVAVTDEFMTAVKENKDWALINPRTKKAVKTIPAKDLLELIIHNAWSTGDPGLIFIDEINRRQPTPEVGMIEATNPCGEVPALPYESCNLGSINLAQIVAEDKIDWEKLKKLTHWGIRFLDNVIEVNKFPLPEIEKITRQGNRKIGLGVMGFAEMLIKLNISYDSEKALEIADQIMGFIQKEALTASQQLGKERGSFGNFPKSIFKNKYPALRNATVTSIAPTGSIGIIAGCSSGIEPLFAIAYVREVMEGTRLLEVNPVFEEVAKREKFYSKELILQIAKKGSLHDIPGIPESIKRIFVTAFDIAPHWHVRLQSVFQKYSDNGVSKTINLPTSAVIDEVRNIYLLAHQLKCKGITIFRYGSKKEQVLYVDIEKDFIKADSEYSGGCASGVCPF